MLLEDHYCKITAISCSNVVISRKDFLGLLLNILKVGVEEDQYQ